MMFKVKFIEIGRDKKSWEKLYEGEPGDLLLVREAKKKLLSNEVSIVWSNQNNATVIAGLYTVGRIQMSNVETNEGEVT